VPPYGAPQCGEAGTIEYAIAVLKVPDVIICGHSHCGAMSGLLHPEAIATLPAVQLLLSHAESTRRIITENYQHLEAEDARLTATIEENVLVQLENLRTHPAVAAGLARHALTLHGWVYRFETGEVFAYDPAEGQFLPLRREIAARPARPPDRLRPSI
jgi:carbonic anhydrase